MLAKNAHENGVEVPDGNSILLDISENAPESRLLGKAFRLGAYSTPLKKYVFPATHKHAMSYAVLRIFARSFVQTCLGAPGSGSFRKKLGHYWVIFFFSLR